MGFWNSVKTFLDPDDGYEEIDEEMYEEELQSNVQDYEELLPMSYLFNKHNNIKRCQKFL